MPLSSLEYSTVPASDIDTDALVLGVAPGPDGPRLVGAEGFEELAPALSALGATGAAETLVRVPSSVRAGVIVLVGLGSAEPDDTALRNAAGAAVRLLAGSASVALSLPAGSDGTLAAVAEGAALGSYSFTAFRGSTAAAAKAPVEHVVLLGGGESADPAVLDRALVLGRAVGTVKDLVNTPPSHLYPQTLAEAVQTGAEGLPLEVTVWDEEALAEEGFGGILGVGSGSSRPPRLVKVAYAPEGASTHLALVGKGITFDSGGLSLKPPASMIGMKTDMAGAATVYAVVRAIAELGLPLRATAWLCIAENLPSGTAIRPDDVLTVRGGTTVEVLNTDAEGRLVLADGLVAASEEQPDAIIDVATLTGASVVALGNRTVGALGDDELVSRVLDAARAAGEPFWQMPLPAELRPLLNSDIADIANVKPGNTAGGMLLAGHFLREFVGKRGEGEDATTIPWAHLDIAGPSSNGGGGYGFTGAGATGVSVRALIALAEGFASA
ncbi:leucyl aminopeptidase [Rathayibacter sp. AY1G1]|uniref:leucyl aminopeptidase n=1 Tax=unclassified Rathayibacter TaxID=2609250 RepID=UPI000CE78921|nr:MULTISPECIES: leucyl aminopeptidase [unclassified Rathayibacter]PPF74094.1 leucyl aminopeptidase [Rathayibacter sp. AY1E6]PPG30952.1 leucyl aminopeptidase [Rathayibacter sp. AY2B9]PPH09626.1 leucyl aminopeptidase [Rathayibacter sp. AY1G1]PPH31009.1 leucyl aminopeptidase [Rathayibacter sp. AY1F9]PPH48206.1 leucyl aminopeptidase [Rathayibacter sp. AY1C9]